MVAGLVFFALITAIVGPKDSRIILWLVVFSVSGGGLGFLVGYLFTVIHLVKWWLG
jgi:hypothetical protein